MCSPKSRTVVQEDGCEQCAHVKSQVNGRAVELVNYKHTHTHTQTHKQTNIGPEIHLAALCPCQGSWIPARWGRLEAPLCEDTFLRGNELTSIVCGGEESDLQVNEA